MKPQVASATKLIHAPAEKIYKIIADYRNMHPLILPKPYFLSLHLEEGGFGEGTIVSFTMRLLGQTRSFRALISEPEPGRVLQETDAGSGIVTRFAVISLENDERAQVTISTELRGSNIVEAFLARMLLQKVYREELDLLAKFAENYASFGQSTPASAARSRPSE